VAATAVAQLSSLVTSSGTLLRARRGGGRS
jgi:hypothetical protein